MGLKELIESDEKALRKIENRILHGVATWKDNAEAKKICRRLADRRFEAAEKERETQKTVQAEKAAQRRDTQVADEITKRKVDPSVLN